MPRKPKKDPALAETLLEAAVVAAGAESVASTVESNGDGHAEPDAEQIIRDDLARAFEPKEESLLSGNGAPDAPIAPELKSFPTDPRLASALDSLDRIRASRRKIRELERRSLKRADAAKKAKKALEAALEEHLRLEDELDSGQGSLPFPIDPPEPEDEELDDDEATGQAPPAADAATASEAPPDDDGRSTPIESLGLAEPTLAILRAYGLRTVGDIGNFTEGGGKLRMIAAEIEGRRQTVTAKREEEIVEALTRYWADRDALDVAAGRAEEEPDLEPGPEMAAASP